MNRLLEVLKMQGRSQTWLAKQIGKSYVVTTNYCNNKAQPSISVLHRAADVLKVDIRDLLSSTKGSVSTKKKPDWVLAFTSFMIFLSQNLTSVCNKANTGCVLWPVYINLVMDKTEQRELRMFVLLTACGLIGFLISGYIALQLKWLQPIWLNWLEYGSSTVGSVATE